MKAYMHVHRGQSVTSHLDKSSHPASRLLLATLWELVPLSAAEVAIVSRWHRTLGRSGDGGAGIDRRRSLAAALDGSWGARAWYQRARRRDGGRRQEQKPRSGGGWCRVRRPGDKRASQLCKNPLRRRRIENPSRRVSQHLVSASKRDDGCKLLCECQNCALRRQWPQSAEARISACLSQLPLRLAPLHKPCTRANQNATRSMTSTCHNPPTALPPFSALRPSSPRPPDASNRPGAPRQPCPSLSPIRRPTPPRWPPALQASTPTRTATCPRLKPPAPSTPTCLCTAARPSSRSFLPSCATPPTPRWLPRRTMPRSMACPSRTLARSTRLSSSRRPRSRWPRMP